MLFQFLPRLSDDEYAALEKSIIEHGIQVPILVDENKSVIDGHHRKEIADRFGIDCPRRFAMDLTDEQKRTLALSLNLDRRHLNREQKRELIEKSLKADPHLSNRQHAERVSASHHTVGAVRDELEGRGQIAHVDQRTDSLGRQQPAHIEPLVNTETGEASDDYVTDQADLDAPFEDATDDEIEEAFTAAREQGDVSHQGVVNNLPAHEPQSPPKPRRTPLPDAFWRATYDLGKVTERLERLHEDDRFERNKNEVAARNRSYLVQAQERLAALLGDLPN